MRPFGFKSGAILATAAFLCLPAGSSATDRALTPQLPADKVKLRPLVGPTPGLTAVANAIRLSSKSVSVQVKVLRSIAATGPVEVSVSFNSGAESERRTQTYTPARGANLVYDAREGDGNTRPMRLDISLRELVANGKSFSFSRTLTMTPLYDVRVSALRFQHFSPCDTVGKGDFELRMRLPDGQVRQTAKFKLGFNESRMVPEFRWSRHAVGTQANLHEPAMIFYEDDLGADYNPPVGWGPSLLPGRDKKYSFILDEGKVGPPGSPSGSTGCKAHISYLLVRKLLTFAAL